MVNRCFRAVISPSRKGNHEGGFASSAVEKDTDSELNGACHAYISVGNAQGLEGG